MSIHELHEGVSSEPKRLSFHQSSRSECAPISFFQLQLQTISIYRLSSFFILMGWNCGREEAFASIATLGDPYLELNTYKGGITKNDSSTTAKLINNSGNSMKLSSVPYE